ncbi:hypothetical protein ElyMa_000595300 [Elysia marginata]|uniref:Uncharacterized protein n=1 Tax=Elysia marginata TaxID=1093978 RepID=A0AAV4G6I9_9GAST|nr:hypothetical protein ElyMa_000595300 [Elysia marginata]
MIVGCYFLSVELTAVGNSSDTRLLHMRAMSKVDHEYLMKGVWSARLDGRTVRTPRRRLAGFLLRYDSSRKTSERAGETAESEREREGVDESAPVRDGARRENRGIFFMARCATCYLNLGDCSCVTNCESVACINRPLMSRVMIT